MIENIIVILGFMRTPGVDYTEKFARTVRDEGQRALIAVTLYLKDKDKDSEDFHGRLTTVITKRHFWSQDWKSQCILSLQLP